MNTQTKVTEQDLKELQREVEQWVNTFNYIQLPVLEKYTDNMLFEYIRDIEPDYDEFIMNYNLEDDYNEWLKEIDQEDTEETKQEFCEAEEDFENFLDEQRSENYPMWMTCFEFKHEPGEDVIQAAINSGFGIIEGLDDFNTILFVAGAGYSFYGAHWIPLYLRLPWNEDKAKYFDGCNFKHL
jgi:hypothetical protein